MTTDNLTASSVALYVHWPFCARICPYCDFNVYKNTSINESVWTDALINELNHWAALAPDRSLVSIYFGGGTPSLAPLPVIEKVIEAARQRWRAAPDIEITLEANPTDAEQGTFKRFRSVGINRLSLGIQSFDDDQLNFLGRNHNGYDAHRALDLSLEVFDRTTFDLIYALPEENIASWRQRLDHALQKGADHLSLYQLTIEPGTAFEKAVARHAWSPIDNDLSADLFEETQRITAEAGLPAYEISNHARMGAQSRHNLIYWRGQDYIGIGPGAHGRLTIDGQRYASETALAPKAYLDKVSKTGDGLTSFDALTEDDILTEKLTMGLRIQEGVALRPSEHTRLAPRLAPLLEAGLLTDFQTDLPNGVNHRIAATDAGRMVINHLVRELLA